MDKIIPITYLQSKAKKYVDQVRETEQPVVVTQRGKAAAVLVSYAQFEGWMATQDEMSYPDWKQRLARAEKERKSGKRVTLEAYLKKRARKG